MPRLRTEEDDSRGASTPDIKSKFREIHPRVYAYIRYRVVDVAAAEDLTSEIMERGLTHLSTYDARKGAFSTWMFRIAHNTWVNHLKQQQRRGSYQVDLGERFEDVAAEHPSPEQTIVNQEQRERLLACLGRLSPRQQEILSLRFGGRLSNRSIAKVLKMNERTVSVNVLRALRKLRQQLGVSSDE
jgi:RNA polymerase sigma-70 factor (ECF subfamily)